MIVLAILVGTVFLMVFEVLRIDVVAILCMLALGWSGILTTDEMLSGFSSNAVISMIAVMILGQGITITGVMEKFSTAVLSKVGKNKNKIIGLISASAGTLSAFMQNIGAAALFLPGTLDISRKTKIPVSQFVMPLGFAAILGGTLTMVGSGHLILVNDLLKNASLEPFGLFAVTPIGTLMLVAGILYFFIFGKYILPEREAGRSKKSAQDILVENLGLPKQVWHLQIQKGGPLAGKNAEESGIWDKYKINIIGIASDSEVIYSPWRETKFRENQILAVLGTEKSVKLFVNDYELVEVDESSTFSKLSNPDKSGFAEVIIPSQSELVGKSIREYAFRRRWALEPLILFNKGEEIRGNFSDHKIQQGDTLIVYGLWDHIRKLKSDSDCIVATEIETEPQDQTKTIPAVGSFALAIGLTFMGVPIAISFLTGAMVMILSKVMKIQDAYKAIDWKVVFLLAGLIPLGAAMQKTGAAFFLADQVMGLIEGRPPIFLITAIAIIATLFSLFMSNVGAVVVLAPLVIGMAEIGGLDPRPLVLLAAVSVSNSFILPTHQVNALMMSFGGYKNADYLKAGGGLTILILLITVLFFYFIYF